MHIYLDTADIEEIREAVSWGVLDGVTTNPSLMMKQGTSDLKAVTVEICELVQGPVSAEVVSTDAEGMLREAEEIATWHEHIVVKIPTIREGLKALREIQTWEGVKTNATLVFSATQALLAAKAGATYVSPFVGRLDDGGLNGMEIVEQIVEIFDIYDMSTKVIAASLRHPMHVLEAALAGAHIATMPFAVLKKSTEHPYTEKGLQAFLDDWAKVASPETVR
jgi:transaldolase